MSRAPCSAVQFAVVICQHPDGRFLAVNEKRDRGWWVPAGGVEEGETFEDAARRETMEEAGIEVNLRGILRVEHELVLARYARQRVIFFAEPKDPAAPPKSEPDEESNGARWVTLDQIRSLARKESPVGDAAREVSQEAPDASFRPSFIRGEELIAWPMYLANGGPVYPLSVFTTESAPVEVPPQPTVDHPRAQ